MRVTGWLLAGFVAALGLLRFRFLVTVSGVLVQSLLGASLLTGVTAAFVFAGFWFLRSAESLAAYRARRALRRAQGERDAAEARLAGCSRHLARTSRAYLLLIRTFLLGQSTTQAGADAMESAVWAHLTRTTPAELS
jgi:hypothetical protein